MEPTSFLLLWQTAWRPWADRRPIDQAAVWCFTVLSLGGFWTLCRVNPRNLSTSSHQSPSFDTFLRLSELFRCACQSLRLPQVRVGRLICPGPMGMMIFLAHFVVLLCLSRLILGEDELEISTYRYPYFSKLNIPFPALPEDKRSLDEQTTARRKMEVSEMPPIVQEMYGKYGNCEAYYIHVSEHVHEAVVRVLPPTIFQLDPDLVIEWQIIEADNLLIPHIDINRLTAINFYIDTHDAITTFYNNPSQSFRTPQGNDIFDPDWITSQSSFSARKGDVYLINVAQIHGVSNLTRSKPRVSISVGLHVPFDDVLPFLTHGAPVAETRLIRSTEALHPTKWSFYICCFQLLQTLLVCVVSLPSSELPISIRQCRQISNISPVSLVGLTCCIAIVCCRNRFFSLVD